MMFPKIMFIAGCLWFIHGIVEPIHARSLEEIKQSGEIRLCVTGSSYELYTKTGTAFAESLGVKPVIKKLDTWDELFNNKDGVTVREASYTPYLMETGQCDCYPNDLVIHEWRLKKLAFAVLFKTRMTVVVHRDNRKNFNTEADLKGKHAAVMKGTTYHTWLEEKNKTDFADNPMRITLMPTNDSMIAVDTQTVDFSVIGADGALNWTRNKVQNSVVAFFAGPVTQVGWGFRKGDTDLLEAAQEFFYSQQQVNSLFNAIWKEKVGMSFSEFNLFITGLIGE